MKKKITITRHYFFLFSVLAILASIIFVRAIMRESLFTNAFWFDFASYAATWNVILYFMHFFKMQLLDLSRKFLRISAYASLLSFAVTMVFRVLETGTLRGWPVNGLKNVMILAVLSLFGFFAGFVISGRHGNKVVIVGGGFTGRSVAREIINSRMLRLEIAGYFSDSAIDDMVICKGDEVLEEPESIIGTVKFLGSEKEIYDKTLAARARFLIVAKDKRLNKMVMKAINKLKEAGVKTYYVDEMFEMLSGRLPVRHLEKDYFYYIFREIEKREDEVSLYAFLNRAFNLVFAIAAPVLVSPLMLAATVLVKLTSRGPVFFRQRRIGKGGRPFTLYKFRSMVSHDPEKYSRYSGENDSRITGFGKIIRKLRIDELPQFINIIKGDMNLVGPRAEWDVLVAEYEKKIPFYHQRHIVRPGITGWAQTNYSYGANSTDALYKLQYDLYYIKNRSFRLDFRIMARTVFIMLSCKGV